MREGLPTTSRTSRWSMRDFVRAREPHVRPTAALWSGSTGIVEPEALVRTLKHLCDARDVMLVVGSAAVAGESDGDRLVVRTPSESVTAATVVNCGGLYADDVSAMFGGETFRIYPCRGDTPSSRRRSGTWSTGRCTRCRTRQAMGSASTPPRRRGDRSSSAPRFVSSRAKMTTRRTAWRSRISSSRSRELLPSVTLSDLRLAGSGIRAKLHPPEESFADFMIRRDAKVPALVQVAGIDSPGLTSCLAIARHVGRDRQGTWVSARNLGQNWRPWRGRWSSYN